VKKLENKTSKKSREMGKSMRKGTKQKISERKNILSVCLEIFVHKDIMHLFFFSWADVLFGLTVILGSFCVHKSVSRTFTAKKI
jgi:hypothetical protein